MIETTKTNRDLDLVDNKDESLLDSQTKISSNFRKINDSLNSIYLDLDITDQTEYDLGYLTKGKIDLMVVDSFGNTVKFLKENFNYNLTHGATTKIVLTEPIESNLNNVKLRVLTLNLGSTEKIGRYNKYAYLGITLN